MDIWIFEATDSVHKKTYTACIHAESRAEAVGHLVSLIFTPWQFDDGRVGIRLGMLEIPFSVQGYESQIINISDIQSHLIHISDWVNAESIAEWVE